MKINSFVTLIITLIFSGQSFCQTNALAGIDRSYIERILNVLASDEMKGRHALTEDADRAANFIAQEFKAIGLKTYTQSDYKQTFFMQQVKKKHNSITWDGKSMAQDNYLILGNAAKTHWNSSSKIPVYSITKKDDFATTFRAHAQSDENAIIIVDPSYASFITRFNKIYDKENITATTDNPTTKVFVVANKMAANFDILHENNIQPVSLSNVVGLIPGKTKPKEYVVFSAHYDHIGILPAVGQDSIANGADDDASGTSAIMSLAKYYKNLDDNERTLIFVAFTAEEIGMFGSKYFSNNINPDSVVAMINIEMIGKDAKFGPNSLYITGYDRSNLGTLMQENLKGSVFRFYPDPYPQQNLFYRSDNAVLAALGVPAHTFSTSQIDKDTFYHTVKDEVSSLNIDNIKSSIEAIAIGVSGIVKGIQTPRRVEKLKD